MTTFFKHYRKTQLGFSMLEVVIAMAVGAIGIVAFAGLQLKSIEITEDAHNRATAAFLATEMVERMSSNAQDYGAQIYYQGVGNWTDEPFESSVFDLEIFESCTSVDCTAIQQATNDVELMKGMARTSLPNGDMRMIACDGAASFNCLAVVWNEATFDECALAMDGTGLQDCFIMQIKIW